MKNIIRTASSLLLLALVPACENVSVNLASRVELSQAGELSIASQDVSPFELQVSSDGDWLVCTPAWINASPRYGSGNGTILLRFADNVTETINPETAEIIRETGGVRHGTVSVECASGATSFVVRQDGDPDKPSDEVRAITIAEFLLLPDGPQEYELSGTVTSIANTTYGNLYIYDGTGEVYIYGLLDRDGNTRNFSSLGIEPGDVLTLRGSKTTYQQTTIEIVNAQYLSHEKTLVSLGESSKIISGDAGQVKVSVSWKGDGISVVSDRTWLRFVGISVEYTTNYLVFEADENPGLLRSANVAVSSTLGGKTSTQTLKLSQGQSSTANAGNGSLEKPYSVLEALAVVGALADGVNTEPIYVKGIISGIGSIDTGSYGNATFYISDDGGPENTFYCYRVLYLGNTKFTSADQIKTGDRVLIYGPMCNYKGSTPETVSNQCYIWSINEDGQATPTNLK